MATKNPRIYVTINPDTHSELVQASKQFNTSVSKVAAEIIEMGMSAYIAGLPLMPQDADTLTDEEFATKMLEVALEKLQNVEGGGKI